MKGNLAARVERLEQRIDPKPDVILVYVADSDTEAQARERAIAECGVRPDYRGFIFCNAIDTAL